LNTIKPEAFGASDTHRNPSPLLPLLCTFSLSHVWALELHTSGS